jgi:hypothetical protein
MDSLRCRCPGVWSSLRASSGGASRRSRPRGRNRPEWRRAGSLAQVSPLPSSTPAPVRSPLLYRAAWTSPPPATPPPSLSIEMQEGLAAMVSPFLTSRAMSMFFLRVEKEPPRVCARAPECPFSAGAHQAWVAVNPSARQQVSAGARASPCWSDGRHRPTRFPLCVHGPCVQLDDVAKNAPRDGSRGGP